MHWVKILRATNYVHPMKFTIQANIIIIIITLFIVCLSFFFYTIIIMILVARDAVRDSA